MEPSYWTKLSKEVGWDKPPSIEWPKSIAEINEADDAQILEWYRFLPPAEDQSQTDLIMYLMGLVSEIRYRPNEEEQ